MQIPETSDKVGVSIPAIAAALGILDTQLFAKPNKDGSAMTGLFNNSYANKTTGDGALLFNHDNCLIVLYAVDRGAPTNYIFAVGFKSAGVAPVLNVVKASTLILGNNNTIGTQQINGGMTTQILAYGISIPM